MSSTVSEYLTSNGLRITAARLTVFDVLQKADTPLSMREITQDTANSIDRASVYRTIALFEKIGITRRVHTGWKYKIELGDQFSEHHHHAVCLNCHAIIAIDEEKVADLITSLTANLDFRPTEHRFEIHGLCSQCH